MSDERIDPETLAAFFDGTASPEERDSVMRTVARSKEAYASFLEAAAVYRELEDATAGNGPGQMDVVRGAGGSGTAGAKPARRWIIGPLLIAAGVVAVLFLSRSNASTEHAAIRLAQDTRLTRELGSGSLARSFGNAWDQPPWSVVRGSEASLPPGPRAVRAGARYAELEVAAQAADTDAVRRATEAIGQLLASVEAGAPVSAMFREVSRAPDFGGRPRRAAAAAELRASLGADTWFDLGVWGEMARLAVAARDVAFFAQDGPAIAELRRIVRAGGRAAAPRDSIAWASVATALQPLLSDRAWTVNDLDVIDRAVGATMAVAAR